MALLVNGVFYIRKSITASLLLSFHKLKSGQNVKVSVLVMVTHPNGGKQTTLHLKWLNVNRTTVEVVDHRY